MNDEMAPFFLEKDFQGAFNYVVKNYSERLYWHIRKMVQNHDDANDVLQNTFIKVWRALPNFRNDSAIFTWMYRIATNESITFLRKKKRTILYEEETAMASNNLEADAFFDGNEAQKELHLAIATLPEKQRAVFNLRYFEECSYKQMSEILVTSEGALKASYHHAVKKIEAYIKKH